MSMQVTPAMLAMNPWLIGIIITLSVLIIILIVLYFVGRKLQKKQEDAQNQMEIGKQNVTLLVIDKKRMKLTESGLPSIVIEQTPKYLRRSKVPIVKAKIGPKITSLMCDEKVFDIIPVKKEVKVVMNGIYIMDVKSARGGLEEKPKKKKFSEKLREKADALSKSKK